MPQQCIYKPDKPRQVFSAFFYFVPIAFHANANEDLTQAPTRRSPITQPSCDADWRTVSMQCSWIIKIRPVIYAPSNELMDGLQKKSLVPLSLSLSSCTESWVCFVPYSTQSWAFMPRRAPLLFLFPLWPLWSCPWLGCSDFNGWNLMEHHITCRFRITNFTVAAQQQMPFQHGIRLIT